MYKELYNARAEPLFCSLNLLFSDVPVAVAVVVILNSLLLGFSDAALFVHTSGQLLLNGWDFSKEFERPREAAVMVCLGCDFSLYAYSSLKMA